jgi:hypothetical protein
MAGLAILVGGLLVVRLITVAAERNLPDPFGAVGLRTAVRALPEIAAEQGDLVLFLGSSKVELGFAPTLFDERMREHGHELVTFNLGIGNMNPSNQVIFARRVREALEARGTRSRLTLVELNPFQTTEARRQVDERQAEQILSILATPRSIVSEALGDPTRAARTFVIRYLRDGIPAEAITAMLGFGVEALGGAIPLGVREEPERPPDVRAVLEEREELAFELYAGMRRYPDLWPLGAWSSQWRGSLPTEFAPELLALVDPLMKNLAHPTTLQDDLEHRIRCCDILELHFDEGLVADFIAMIEELEPVSERVVVVLMPKNHAWVENPPEAMERQRRVLERIERETGVRVVDFQYLPDLDASQFFDVTHLTPHEGRLTFTRRFADYWAAHLE